LKLRADAVEWRKLKGRRRAYLRSMPPGLLGMSVLLGTICVVIELNTRVRPLPLSLIAGGLWLLANGEIVFRSTSRTSDFEDHRLWKHSKALRRATWGLVAAVAGSAVYDAVRSGVLDLVPHK
jgi:hypothetical protein